MRRYGITTSSSSLTLKRHIIAPGRGRWYLKASDAIGCDSRGLDVDWVWGINDQRWMMQKVLMSGNHVCLGARKGSRANDVIARNERRLRVQRTRHSTARSVKVLRLGPWNHTMPVTGAASGPSPVVRSGFLLVFTTKDSRNLQVMLDARLGTLETPSKVQLCSWITFPGIKTKEPKPYTSAITRDHHIHHQSPIQISKIVASGGCAFRSLSIGVLTYCAISSLEPL